MSSYQIFQDLDNRPLKCDTIHLQDHSMSPAIQKHQRFSIAARSLIGTEYRFGNLLNTPLKGGDTGGTLGEAIQIEFHSTFTGDEGRAPVPERSTSLEAP